MKNPFKIVNSPALWVIVCAAALALVANWRSDYPYHSRSFAGENPKPSSSNKATPDALLREGTVLKDVRGRFQPANDRVVFLEQGTNRSFKCLENLWLQRILASQKSEDRRVAWIISAKVFEFEGENFLQVENATKTR